MYDAFEGNKSFVDEELSCEDPYEIIVGNLEVHNILAVETSGDEKNVDAPSENKKDEAKGLSQNCDYSSIRKKMSMFF